MQIINDTVRYIQIIAVVLVVIFGLIALAGYYFIKVYRPNNKEKEIDYSKFDVTDSLSFIRFEDVGESMLLTENNTRFVAGIKCKGVDYWNLEESEQWQTIRGYLTFFNVLDVNTIQFRQSAHDVNLDEMIKNYNERLLEMNEKRYTLGLDYEELKKESEREDVSKEEYDVYYDELRKMQREILSLGYQAEQINVQIKYMEAVSGPKADPDREQMYIFDWTYNPLEFSSSELNAYEVQAKAEKQLRIKAQSYIKALRNAGVKAHMMTGTELLQEFRRYTHPISSNKYTVEDILETAYDSIVVTSDSLKDKEAEVNKLLLKKVKHKFGKKQKRRKNG